MVMTKRSMKTTLRDPMGMAGCVLQSVIMALIYGWIFFKLGTDEAGIRSREGAISIAIYQSYLMLMLEVYRLTVDIRLFDMEHSDGVAGVPAFLLSRRVSKLLPRICPFPWSSALFIISWLDFEEILRRSEFFLQSAWRPITVRSHWHAYV